MMSKGSAGADEEAWTRATRNFLADEFFLSRDPLSYVETATESYRSEAACRLVRSDRTRFHATGRVRRRIGFGESLNSTKAELRRATLTWGDGSMATATLEEGWRCDNRPLEQVLNVGWPLRVIASEGGSAPDPLVRMANEVAKIFSAKLLEIA